MQEHAVSHELLMRYLDGEVDAAEGERVERHLAVCSECRREHAIFSSLKEDLAAMRFHSLVHRRSAWDAVNRRLTRPVGWVLLVGGFLLWVGYAAYVFVGSPAWLIEKLAFGAVIIGFVMLLLSVVWERVRDWKSDPYREIER